MAGSTQTQSRYLVTGGAGFIGAGIVARLLDNGNHVTVLDNCSRGSAERLDFEHPQLSFYQGDVRDYKAVTAAMEGCHSIIHLAYVNGTEFFYEKPELILDIALRGMLNLVDAAEALGVREFILASSSEVYQDPGIYPTPESVPLTVPDVMNPRYSYGGGKIASELLLLYRPAALYDRRMIFRPHNVYGPDMGHEHVIPQLIAKVLAAEADKTDERAEITIQGDGNQTRSFVFIDDFVDGVMAMLDQGVDRAVYNIGSGEETRIIDLVHAIQKLLGVLQHIVADELPAGSVLRRLPDIARLRQLGFSPQHNLDEGLSTVVDWYRRQYGGE